MNSKRWLIPNESYQSDAYIIKKCIYTAHAFVIETYEDAETILNKISNSNLGLASQSYAIRIFGDQYFECCDDDGDFGSGDMILSCLKSCNLRFGTVNKDRSILLVVTLQVKGCFVSDMIANMKYNAIRTCCRNSLDKLDRCIENVQNATHPKDSLKDMTNLSPQTPKFVLKSPDDFGLHENISPKIKKLGRVSHFALNI